MSFSQNRFKYQRGIVQLLPLLVLVLGIAVGVSLVNNPTFFKPRASSLDVSEKVEAVSDSLSGTSKSSEPDISNKNRAPENQQTQASVKPSPKTQGPNLACNIRTFSDDPRNRPDGYYLSSTISTISPNQVFVYNTTVKNYSNQQARNVSVGHTLPSGLTIVDTDSKCTVDGTRRNVVCNVGDFNPGEEKNTGSIRIRKTSNDMNRFELRASISNPEYVFGECGVFSNDFRGTSCNSIVPYRDDPANKPGSYKIDTGHRINLGEKVTPGQKVVVAIWPKPLNTNINTTYKFLVPAGTIIDTNSGCQTSASKGSAECSDSISKVKAVRIVVPQGTGHFSVSGWVPGGSWPLIQMPDYCDRQIDW